MTVKLFARESYTASVRVYITLLTRNDQYFLFKWFAVEIMYVELKKCYKKLLENFSTIAYWFVASLMRPGSLVN